MIPHFKLWERMSLRHKLLFLFLVVVIFPAGVTIFLCDRIARDVVLEHTRDAMRQDAIVAASAIRDSLRGFLATAEQYSSAIGGPYCHSDDDLSVSHISANMERRAKALLSNHDQVRSVTVFDSAGEALLVQRHHDAKAARSHAAEWSEVWEGKTILAGPFAHTGPADAYVEVRVPVLDGSGEVTAVCVLEVPLAAILSDFYKVDETLKEKSVILLDAQGIRIWDNRSKQYLFKPALELTAERLERIVSSRRFGPATRVLMSGTAAIPGYSGRAEVKAARGFFDTHLDDQAGKGYAWEIPIGGTVWTLLYTVPERVFYAELRRVDTVIVFATAAAAVAALLLGVGLSRLITTPISRLNQALDRFAQGDHEARLEYEGSDEIGDLADSFNQMAVSVMSFQYEVEQQNQDLSEANRKMRLLNYGLEQTVRERTEEIRKEKEKLDAVVSRVRVALATLDTQMRVTWSNVIAEEVFPELRLLRRREVTNEAGSTCAWPVARVLDDGRIHADTILVAGAEGRSRWWLVTAVPMMNASGEIESVLEMVQDVTQQKIAAQRVLQTEKMSTIGYLASGISHEFNNIMCAILGHANLAKTQPEKLDRLVDVVTRQCDRAAKITQGLLNMSRRKESGMKHADLTALIDEVVELMENEVSKEGTQLIHSYRATPRTLVNESHFQQVVLALIINARQAIGQNGVIEIAVDSDGDRATVAVTDNGCGIPPEHLDKIFEPFFTTKGALGAGSQQGTGLGLSSVYNIVTNHGGEIQIQSQVGQGTTVTLTLPIREERRAQDVPVEVDRRKPDAASARFRVLVADDEEELRELLKILLTLERHEVELAANAEEALHKAAEGNFDFLFLDLKMPGPIDSWTALEEIKRTAPDTKVILISGSDIDPNAQGALGDADAFLRKPFENEQIEEIMAEVAGGHGPLQCGVRDR